MTKMSGRGRMTRQTLAKGDRKLVVIIIIFFLIIPEKRRNEELNFMYLLDTIIQIILP